MSIPKSFLGILVIMLLSSSIVAINAQPPLMRAVASQPVIVDANNNLLCCLDQYHVNLNQRILIKSTISSITQPQSFVYIVKVTDSEGVTAMLSWVISKLGKDESADFTQSWTPDNWGQYTVEIFVWESMERPSALSPVRSVNVVVTAAPSYVECDGKLIPSINYTNGISYPVHPVLLMHPNSTGTVCVTYQILYNWEVYSKGGNVEGIFHFGLHIGRNDKFILTAIPDQLDLTGATAGSKFAVIYKIHAMPNSKGFYSHAVPKGSCLFYPLAVGHAATQVKASDFALDTFTDIPPPCAMLLYGVDSVRISGMNYTNIVFHP